MIAGAGVQPASQPTLVISSEVEKSLITPASMGRDYHFWVYIVTHRNDFVLYIGVTNSLARRSSQHREGAGSHFATIYKCTKLIYHEHYDNVRDAIAREKQLKRWSRAKKVALIARLNPRWRDLGDDVLGE